MWSGGYWRPQLPNEGAQDTEIVHNSLVRNYLQYGRSGFFYVPELRDSGPCRVSWNMILKQNITLSAPFPTTHSWHRWPIGYDDLKWWFSFNCRYILSLMATAWKHNRRKSSGNHIIAGLNHLSWWFLKKSPDEKNHESIFFFSSRDALSFCSWIWRCNLSCTFYCNFTCTSPWRYEWNWFKCRI